jgi:hypothetical protein
MKWALVIWLASANQFTIYESFDSVEQCLAKKETVTKALKQAESKMQINCQQRRPGDVFKGGEVVVSRYTFR